MRVRMNSQGAASRQDRAGTDVSAPHHGIRYSDSLGTWLVTGYPEAEQIMLDDRFRHAPPPRWASADARTSPAARITKLLENNLVTLQTGEKHRRQRRAMSRMFSRAAVERLRPRCAELVASHLGIGRGTVPIDLLSQVTEPVMRALMADLIGLPGSSRQRFDELAHRASLINGYGSDHWSEAALTDVVTAFADLSALVRETCDARRSAPADDLITAFVQAPGSASLSHDEIVVNTWVLYLTGIRITGYLAAASVYFLLSRQDLLARAREDPDLVPGLVQETLRFAPSAVEPTPRIALEDVPVAGVTIRAGETVRIYYLDTNRDPRKFDRPDRFDPLRRDGRAQTFYVGPHFCVGAQVATVMAEETCRAVAARTGGVSLAEEPRFERSQNSPVMLGVEKLLITIGQ